MTYDHGSYIRELQERIAELETLIDGHIRTVTGDPDGEITDQADMLRSFEVVFDELRDRVAKLEYILSVRSEAWWNTWGQRDQYLARAKELTVIVERLPKTADGVPIVPNDVVWWIGTDGNVHKWIPYIATDGRVWHGTREAAEAARRELPNG